MDNSKPSAAPKWGINRRLTPKLAGAGFTAVPITLLEHYRALDITTGEAMFLIQLLSYKWGAKHPFPKFARIAQRMGMTETAVRGYARNLEKKKCLSRIAHAGRSNEFDLTPLFVKLEELLPSSKRP